MARLDILISFQLWEATSSISIMRMLAEQAENNANRAVEEANLPDFVTRGVFIDEGVDMYGDVYQFKRTYYSCGSCVGYELEEVKSEYIHLITQLTRRSAFLTIFGLFENRMGKCLELMKKISGYTKKLKNGVIENTHTVLTKSIGGNNITDVDHLTVIRNIMAHNDGIASNYKKLSTQRDNITGNQIRLIKSIRRTEGMGITVNPFNGVLMNGQFLMHSIDEIEQYIMKLDAAIQAYHRTKMPLVEH